MIFKNYRKETSERSDAGNWAKKLLAEKTGLFFDSIEGCNENNRNIVTHLMERARVDATDGESSDADVLAAITALESTDVLQRKINFAKAFRLPLTYVLYCDEMQSVWVYTITDVTSCIFKASYNSYQAFSDWIAAIKGWKSSKPYREQEDLPFFDKALRRAGTAWPTNIDCFVSTKLLQPIGIIEFQNAKNTRVERHCNNEFFLGKYARTNPQGYTLYDNDIRRWQSQEILRLQSGLRLFIITWSQTSKDFILKEIEVITFPNLPFSSDLKKHNEYQLLMHKYANSRDKKVAAIIASQFSTYKLTYSPPQMRKDIQKPPLCGRDKTFPLIYYRYKKLEQGHEDRLPVLFMDLLSRT